MIQRWAPIEQVTFVQKRTPPNKQVKALQLLGLWMFFETRLTCV
jgi:hypothetical protein